MLPTVAQRLDQAGVLESLRKNRARLAGEVDLGLVEVVRRTVVGEEQTAEALAAQKERDRQRGAHVELFGYRRVAEGVVAVVLERDGPALGQGELGVGHVAGREAPADGIRRHPPDVGRDPDVAVLDGDAARIATEGLAGQAQRVRQRVARLEMGAHGAVDGVQRLAEPRVAPLLDDQPFAFLLPELALVDLAIVGTHARRGGVDTGFQPPCWLRCVWYSTTEGLPSSIASRSRLTERRLDRPAPGTRPRTCRRATSRTAPRAAMRSAPPEACTQRYSQSSATKASSSSSSMARVRISRCPTGRRRRRSPRPLSSGAGPGRDSARRSMRTSRPPSSSQLERVGQGGDDEQARPWSAAGSGLLRGSKLATSKPRPRSLTVATSLVAVKRRAILMRVARAAVTNGVGAGLFDAQDGVVDHPGIGAVLAQVVAQALPGAQQVRGFGRNLESQTRWRRPRLHTGLRHVTLRPTPADPRTVHSMAAAQSVSSVAAPQVDDAARSAS